MSIVHFHLVLTWDIVSLSAVEGGLTKASCKETCFKGILPACFGCAQHDMGVVRKDFRDSGLISSSTALSNLIHDPDHGDLRSGISQVLSDLPTDRR
jgi:hypothetical protein